MTDEQMAAYIAGFIDGEGHIGLHHNTRGIAFCNTDKSLIDYMCNLLNKLGFDTKTYFRHTGKENWADVWTVYIRGGRAAYEKFQETIPIQSPAKIAALKHILNSYSDPEIVAAKRRNGETRNCEICGKPIYKSKAYQDRGGGRFCSHTCRGLAQRNRGTKQCEICGTDFIVITARLKTARFCSLQCMGEHKRLHDRDRLASQARAAALARWHP